MIMSAVFSEMKGLYKFIQSNHSFMPGIFAKTPSASPAPSREDAFKQLSLMSC